MPKLDDEQLILKGAGQYAAMCTGCHLKPGMTESTPLTPKRRCRFDGLEPKAVPAAEAVAGLRDQHPSGAACKLAVFARHSGHVSAAPRGTVGSAAYP